MFSWLSKFLRVVPRLESKKECFVDGIYWISAADNPWMVDILDCRALTQGYTAMSSDARVAACFKRLRSSDGRQHLEAMELPYSVDGVVRLEISEPPPEGILFSARQMEHKWDVYHWNKTLFVARSWTGDLTYTARIDCDGACTTLSEIRSIKETPEYSKRELHFLMLSHCQLLVLPCPVPAFDLSASASEAENTLAAMHALSMFGRFGWFATPSNMTTQPSLDPESVNDWLKQHPCNRLKC